ncbi:MAG TPA: galactokinase, partial [Firmicutes bacterium]|nr:galactokinase [Bacillota bacterium]
MNSNDHLLNLFQKIYGPGGEIISGRAPGRVNLIGEHTDYNEGYVFPMAIEFEIKMAIRKRKDSIVRVYAVDYDQLVEVSLNKELTCNPQYQGCNYPLAVLWALNKNGIKLPGMEIAFSGNIPLGAGLSSSAAL